MALTDEDLARIAELVKRVTDENKDTRAAVHEDLPIHWPRRVLLIGTVVVVMTLTDKFLIHYEVLAKTSELSVSAVIEWLFTRARQA